MRRKLKNFLVLCIIATSIICTVAALTQTSSITNIDMDYVYFDIYKIDITDDFDGKGSGGIDLKFKFYYERMFGTYGDRLYNDDDQYVDYNPSWIYYDTFDHDDTGEQIISATSSPSYCYRMTYAGYELKLGIKVTKGIWNEDHSIEVGYLWNYNMYYWTAEVSFNNKFDGAMKLYIKIVY